ncbi:MAG: asparagine synthase (glutamine-hydrolyzing) [Chitinophagaceae bacterium]|nr:asparagine synthase (glutamine-hydrolyzing) [Chitinophagaceae bacterium]
MCGIAGLIAADGREVSLLRVKKMTDSISHRGPDGEGHWISPNGKLALGHRRLSIIDLSHEADQPMHYLDRYTLIFNGEIYNYVELKETLQKQGYRFKTASDTEVLLALYHRDRENCLSSLDGMFAFVIYDEQENTVFAARDRFGEKPFFYSHQPGGFFLFGSEMKALWAGGVEKKVNYRMLYGYLAYASLENRNDPGETFYENCRRLPHSHYLKLDIDTCTIRIERYYDMDYRNTNQRITVEQAKERFRELFYTSVSRRLRSDVPVGSSLSGGLDSSLVVAVIDRLNQDGNLRQDSFSAIFPGFKKDERKYMDYVIAKTNLSPHFVTPDETGLIDSIDTISWHQEEPFGSASIYAQYCVMRLAKENNITVLLDGQGADEILAGYHVFYPPFFREMKKKAPEKFRQEIAAYEAMHGNSEINADIRSNVFTRMKISAGNTAPGLRKWFHHLRHLKDPVFEPGFYRAFRDTSAADIPVFENLNQALYHSLFDQGLQELLRYADRNSMAHGREVRLPFLYHELVEFLLTLPAEMKIHEGWTKWIMRETFTQELPPEICWRTDKIGYSSPQDNWMNRAEVKEKLEAAKHLLVKEHIINHTMQSKEMGKDQDWRIWMAASIIQ